ncbi:FAD-dependent oxidoreductase [Fructobacillus cardui]|uniref:FAD-dependent oxidoreductase n=1 Tax=Fructobacillus cardui TaxID=2893170 RepID=UPI00200A2A88|nr:FAD-dependent oxidoreductase [Fructobacillus cardui]MCK8627056.1 FAD-dependent oxidoreductase [Fructobacillus cardui]
MLKRYNFSLGLTWLVIFFVIPLPLLQTLSAGLPAIYSSQSQAIYLGAIAYAWMLTSIYLATKPHWLDRLIGLPDMYMIHGIISILAIVLAYLHKFGNSSDGWIKITGDWAIYLFTGIMVYSMIFMAGWFTSRIPFLAKLKRTLETVFKHELSVWLHRLNLIATLLVFIHVQLISYVTTIHPFMFVFYAYSGIVFISYVMSKVRSQLGDTRGTVMTNEVLAPNVQELTITPQKHYQLNLRMGDFVFISFPDLKGLKEYHPFSIVNPPSDDSQHIKLAIRGDGDFTKLLSEIKPGVAVKLSGGYGRYHSFLEDNDQDHHIVMIAGGIGVTPLLSIVEGSPERHISLFYSAHYDHDLIYLNQLKDWHQRDNFDLHYQVGRYSEADVLNHQLHDLPNNTIFLISGPAPMIRYWKRTLKKNGIRNGQMYAEEFTW